MIYKVKFYRNKPFYLNGENSNIANIELVYKKQVNENDISIDYLDQLKEKPIGLIERSEDYSIFLINTNFEKPFSDEIYKRAISFLLKHKLNALLDVA